MDDTTSIVIAIVVFLIILALIILLFVYFFNGGVQISSQLSGSQEVPPVLTTQGTGQFTGTLNSCGTSLSYSLTVNNLTSPPVNLPGSAGAHFHAGSIGQNGPILKDIELVSQGNGVYSTPSGATWSSTDSQQPLTSDIVNMILNGQVYVNVHTAMHMSGEIRGQI